MSERFAIYYAPATTTALWRLAAEWLGRDPAGGDVAAGGVAGLPRDYLRAVSVSAWRYGFHATIKAPMTLADGTDRARLEQALRAFAAQRPQVPIGPLRLTLLDGFLALMPEQQGEALTRLAGDVVAQFDHFRRPMGEAERKKRMHGGLSPRQVGLLERYGYPYVMDEFRFHMTLSDRLAESDRDAVLPAALEWFAPVSGRELVLDRLSLYREPEPGAPFVRAADFPLAVEVKLDA